MNKANRKHTPKLPPQQAIIEHASPELRSLIETHDTLPVGDWSKGLAIKDRHGRESDIAKHVDKVWTQCASGKKTAFNAAVSFPARGYADIAAKITFARTQWPMNIEPVAPALDALLDDLARLGSATPSDTADERLLELVRICEALFDVQQALWARSRAAREAAEEEADRAGFGKPIVLPERAERDQFIQSRTSGIFERAHEANTEMGRAAKAVFAVKARTFRGAIGKLRIALTLHNTEFDELATWQGHRDWLSETLADFERIDREQRGLGRASPRAQE